VTDGLLRGLPPNLITQHFEEDGAIVSVQTRLPGHRFKTAMLGLSLGAIRALGEGQVSESASRHARGWGGLGGGT
jgi:hypothetical protein